MCTVTGCVKRLFAHGLCSMHYTRQRRYGTTAKPQTLRESLIKRGRSFCPKCQTEKPLEAFNKDRHTAFGVAIYCRECSNRKSGQRYSAHKDSHRDKRLQNDFGLTAAEYERILAQQGNVCAICGEGASETRRFAVDHCHKTKRIRGLLCDRCNCGLGNFKDRVELLEFAAQYLVKAVVLTDSGEPRTIGTAKGRSSHRRCR